MTPFEKADVPESEIVAAANDLYHQWINGEPLIRKQVPADHPDPRTACLDYVRQMQKGQIVFLNDSYQVAVSRIEEKWFHLSIKRLDRAPIHDWRDLQEIKNQIIGHECEAVELYPAESRVVDTANQFHLWGCSDPAFRFPVGWNEGRHVIDKAIGKSVNRPRTTKPSTSEPKENS